VNRKHWGGNRTDHGAETQQTLMSVIRTARQQDICPIALLTDLLRQRTPTPTPMLRLPRYRVTVHRLHDGTTTKVLDNLRQRVHHL
jgi:hypothetical protein